MKKYVLYLPHSVSALVLAIISYFGSIYSYIAIIFASDAISLILNGQTDFPNQEEGIYVSEFNEPLAFGLFLYLIIFVIFIILLKKEYKNTTQKQNNVNILKILFIYAGLILFFIPFFYLIYVEGCYLLNFIKG